MVKLFEKLKLYFNMINLSRKTTIVMFLGLGISLALISEGLMFMFSFQYGAFTDFSKGTPTRQFTISLTAYDVRGYSEASIPLLSEAVENAISNAEIGDFFKRLDWFISRGFFLVLKQTTGSDIIVPNINLYGIPSDYFSVIENILLNGSIPKGTGEVIAVARSSTIAATNLSNLGLFAAYTPIFGYNYESVIDLGIPAAGCYLNITGLITKESFISVEGKSSDDFKAMADYFSEEFLITTHTNLAQIVSSLQYITGYIQVDGRVAFNLDEINSFAINSNILLLQKFAQELSREIEKKGFTLTVYTNLINDLRSFLKEFVIFQLFGVLFITPVIGMALSLTNYSANLMKRKQKHLISSMIQRGTSQNEIVFVLLLQVIELTLTALVVSVILGFGFTWLMSKSIGFLNFGGMGKLPLVNLGIFYSIVGIGFFLSILINTKNVYEMSKLETHEAYIEHQTKTPGWKKLYLDIILISIGVILWIIVSSQLTRISAYAFAMGMGTTAPVLIVLGSILFAVRVYPHLVDFLSKITWKSKRLRIIGLSAKRISRRKNDATRSLVLLSLTFTLIFSSIITIQSYKNFDVENAYYTLGSDILIRNINFKTNTTKNAVLDIDGVEGATILKVTSQIITYGSLIYSYIVVGIIPEEFSQFTYSKPQYFDGQDPQDFFEKIKDSNDVLMQKDQLNIIDSYVNQQITIRYEKYPLGVQNKTLDVVGIYKFFPRFFIAYPVLESSVFRFTIIGSYDNLQDFSYADYSISGDLLVKVKAGYDISEVASNIEATLNRPVEHVEQLMGAKEGSLRNTMLYSALNASYISSIIISIIAIALMILIQSVENEREIITLRILGISPKQLILMFLNEAISVVLFGAFIGICIGILTASMFVKILTHEVPIPTHEMGFSPLELLVASIILFSATFLAALFTSFVVFHKNINKALKEI